MFCSKQFDKSYSDPSQEELRLEIFERNVKFINDHNEKYFAGKETFWLRMNHLGDLTHSEYRKRLGFRPSAANNVTLKTEGCTHEAIVPNASVDWRNAGVVTDVKDQGQCGR